MSLQALSWRNDDPSVARIEWDSVGVWTISGLKVGEASLVMKHRSTLLFWRLVQVVESQDT